MTREKTKKIIRDLETKILSEGLKDDTISYEHNEMVGPVSDKSDSRIDDAKNGFSNKLTFKNFIKYKILKPGFAILYGISPSGAVFIRNNIYKVAHKFKHRNQIINDIPMKKQDETIEMLVDSTITSKTEIKTGIQRVVNNIIRNLCSDIVIGTTYGGAYQTNFGYRKRLRNDFQRNVEYEIDFKKVKNFVLLDSSWEQCDLFEEYLKSMNKFNSTSFSVVYDLLPIKYPDIFEYDYFVSIFTKWHNMILTKTDHIMCISKAVADDVIEYYSTAKIKRDKPLAISYFPLGADLPTVKNVPDKFIRNKIKNFVSENTFLMVGTIEPRKGHLVALEAITKRLDDGDDIKLLIIGRNGWKNEEFINLLNKNRYYGKDILWLDDANDIELAWCYQHACCLIAASKDEGYGLPLVEAAHYGVPIICSDIPVFREVAQGYADYFKVWDSGALADTIKQWLNSDEHPDSKSIKIYSWAEATKIFMEIVNGKREPYKIIE